jgi:hypothetical protein
MSKRLNSYCHAKKILVDEFFLDHMIDLGTCKKALEDVVFLADNSIKNQGLGLLPKTDY